MNGHFPVLKKFYLLIIAVMMIIAVTSCRGQGVTLVDITMEGGTGKAHINSPVQIIYSEGITYAKLVWSSKNYDHVIVDGVTYPNENPGGYSTFTVPVASFDRPMELIGNTVAMSTPHDIEYTIFWNSAGESKNAGEDTSGSERVFGRKDSGAAEPDLCGLEKTGSIPLKYAKGFDISLYGKYTLVNIYGAGSWLIVPEGCEAPEGLSEDITVLRQPFEKTYLVSTSAMDLVRECGCLDRIRFSPLEADDWYIDEAVQRMISKDMIYAGKYRAPDYELLLGEGCDLAVENTMIYHDPQVMEKLKELGIPVIVETSSYESDPLGRLEWIKLYGVLFGTVDKAEEFFDREAETIEAVGQKGSTGKSAAFFSISSTGMVNVRRPGDYMAALIGLAGAEYVPAVPGTGTDGSASSMNMQMEDFYAGAKDADVIIYNSTIEDEPEDISALTGMSPLFLRFKAVKDKKVYCLRKSFFQSTTKMSELIEDLSAVLSGSDDDLRFLYRLE